MCREVYIIELFAKEPVGFFVQPNIPWGSILPVIVFEIKAGFEWPEVTATLLEYLIYKSQKLSERGHYTCDLSDLGWEVTIRFMKYCQIYLLEVCQDRTGIYGFHRRLKSLGFELSLSSVWQPRY